MDPSQYSSNIQVSAANKHVHSEDAATGNNGDGCLSTMHLDVYNAAKRGDYDALQKYLKDHHLEDQDKDHHLEDQDLSQILTPTKNTVLHIYIACSTEKEKNSAKTQRMLNTCRSLLWRANESGDTPLHTAARFGRAGMVELLIDEAAKEACPGDLENGLEQWRKLIRTTNKEGDTALHQAVRFNHLDVVKTLIKQDPKFSYSVNFAGETPLYLAAERGYTDLVSHILETSTNPAYQGPNGRTALHAAVVRNDKEMTKNLLEKMKDLTKAVDDQGCTPLHLAASFGHASIVKKLLECDRSAAYVRENDQKMTALHFAASKGHKYVMKELIAQCPDCCELVDQKGRNLLHCAIDAGNSFLIEGLVFKDPWLSNVLLNGKDDKGDTPLHRLATCGSMYSYSSLGTDAKVDKMAFNKENRNAFDILVQDSTQFYYSSTQGVLKDNLKMNGVMRGCRIVSNKDVKNIEGDEYSKVKDSHMVAATLIATVSFAAGFTMPGGYQGDKGPDQGFTVLTRNVAFQAFVITNTIAMTLSSCSVLLYLYSAAFYKRKVQRLTEAFTYAYMSTMLALIAMVIAFITGTYAVLSHSSVLAMVVCVLGCILFFVLAEFLIYDERGILKGPRLVPLGILLWLIWFMVPKMKYVISKLSHKCLWCVSLICTKTKRKVVRNKDLC